MKNAEGFKFMKSQKQGGQGGRGGPNSHVVTGPRPYFNRDGAKFSGQRFHHGQGSVWKENQMAKPQLNNELPQRKLQPWSGLGANHAAEETGNHRTVHDYNAKGNKKRKSTGGY